MTKRATTIDACNRHFARDNAGRLVSIAIRPEPNVYGWIVRTGQPIPFPNTIVYYDDAKPDTAEDQ